ncbi:MAG: hypothetical protein ACC726_08050 [Chloroflexota bacterium]
MPRWRVETWIFIGWNVVVAALLIWRLPADHCPDLHAGCSAEIFIELVATLVAVGFIWLVGPYLPVCRVPLGDRGLLGSHETLDRW